MLGNLKWKQSAQLAQQVLRAWKEIQGRVVLPVHLDWWALPAQLARQVL